MGGLVYDSGPLVAAARGQTTAWQLHCGALERNEVPMVIAPVLTRAWGQVAGEASGEHLLVAFLRGCAVVDFPVGAAYDAGRLLARSGTTDVVAAAVVLAAITTRSAVITTDQDGIRALAGVLGVDLPVAAIGQDSAGRPSSDTELRVAR